MLLSVLLFVTTAAHSAGPDLSKLNTFIDAGQPRRAGPVLRKMLMEDPDNHEARAALGRAFAVMSRCEEALVHLRAVRPTPAWTGKVSASEASCHVYSGNLSEARVAYEEALWMNPRLLSVRHAFTLLLIQLGEWEEAEAQIDLVAAQDGWPHRASILRIHLAHASGENAWPLLQELRRRLKGSRSKPALQQLYFLEGQLWLDAGSPDDAEAAFTRSIELVDFHEASILGRAESLRRAGSFEGARLVANRKILHSSPMIHPIRARILVDLGDLKGAGEEIAMASAPNHIETLASRWYLARAQGEATAELEQAWANLLLNSERRLMDLVPLESR